MKWINEPESGRLTGTLFLDGSGLFPQWQQLRRAGWSIVQVDRFGEMQAAAYGPVPVDFGPGQVARDGEDFAVFMLTICATPPFQLFIDCEGTLKCLHRGVQYAAGPGNPRAHMWGPFYAQFEGEEFTATKTLAHPSKKDVEENKTTVWK